MSVDKKLLYQLVSRCVWHDGLRLTAYGFMIMMYRDT